MPSFTVKNIPESLLDQVRRQAKANRRSLNSEIIVCIERAVGGSPVRVEETLAEARAIRERSAAYIVSDEDFDEAKERGRR